MMSRTAGDEPKNQTIPGRGGEKPGETPQPRMYRMCFSRPGEVMERDCGCIWSIHALCPRNVSAGVCSVLGAQDTADSARRGDAGMAAFQQARLLLREFLSVVPRTEETTTITFLRVDGTQQTLSRQELSTAIDRMRPRQRQIVRLAIESHWSQERVCAELKGISVRTVQRDLAEALDRLGEL